MMTPQEVASCTFAKAVMGGYNMAAVDDFLDKLTEDYSELYKENNTLKSKLKVVADKLKEYREMEETMRTVLLTSQKMANNIVAEAEQQRDSLIADAAGAAKLRLDEIQAQVAQEERRLAETHERVERELEAEERRLAAGQEQLRAFIQDVTAVCSGQLALLEKLPELPVQPPQSAPAVPEEPAPAPQEAAQPQTAGPEEKASQDMERDLDEVFSSFGQDLTPPDSGEDGDPFAGGGLSGGEGEDSEATRVINLDDLQFGRNYTRD